MTYSTLVDGVRVATSTVGTTSPMVLGLAAAGYLGTSALVDGRSYSYSIIADGTNCEFGQGVYVASGPSLTRVVSSGSNGTSPIILSGSAVVNITDLSVDIGRPTQVGKLIGANFNSTADQAITLTGPTLYLPHFASVTNMSIPPATAKGGFYSAASKSGSLFGTSSVTSWSGYVSTAYGAIFTANNNGGGTPILSMSGSATIYLSLTTPQGSAATGDIYIFGLPLIA